MELDRKQIFKLLIPVMIDQTFITLLPMANTIIVSKLGQTSMAGVSIIDQVNQLVAFTVVAIGFGGAIMVAQYTGRGDKEGISRVIKQSYSSSLMLSLVIAALVFACSDGVVQLAMKTAEPAMKAVGKTYLMITCTSYPFYCFYSNTSQILRGIGQPRRSMYVSVFMNIGTFLMSLTFIYFFKMGIVGAALATLAGRVFGTLYGLYMVIKSGTAKKIGDFFTFKLNPVIQKMMIQFGVPMGLQNFFFVGARLVINRCVQPYGTAHMAAVVVFTQILDLQCTGSTLVTGMAPAIMGMAKGREDQTAIRSAFKDLCFFGFWLGIVFALVPVPLAGMFTKIYHLSAEAAVMAKRMIIFNPLYIIPLVWFGQIAPAGFRGIGDTTVPPLITVGSLWVGRVGTIFVLTTFFGIGAYAAYFAVLDDYVLRNLSYFWRYKSGAWLRAQKSVT